MKECPSCGSNDVTFFDDNNDFCDGCKKWFPAVGDSADIIKTTGIAVGKFNMALNTANSPFKVGKKYEITAREVL